MGAVSQSAAPMFFNTLMEVPLMRIWFPVAILCALAVAAFAGQDLAAKCRCNVSARRAAKLERKAARRGGYQYQYVTPDNNYRPDDGGVQPLGAAAPADTEWAWDCNGRRCRLVRVPVARPAQPIPPKPQPDPAFKSVTPDPPATPPPTPAAKTEAAVIVPAPTVNMLAGSDVPEL